MGTIERLLPNFIRSQYLAKFTLIVILVIGLVGIGGYAMVTEASDTLETQQQNQVKTNANLNANQTAQWVNKYRQVARMMSQYKEMREQNIDGINQRLERDEELLPKEVYQMHYVFIGGPVVASTHPDEVGKQLSQFGMDWQRELAFRYAEHTRMSYTYEHNGVKQVAFASKVQNTQHALVVMVNVSDRSNEFRTGIDGSTTQVVDENGTVQFHQNSGSVLTDYQYGSSFSGISAAAEGQSGVIEVENDGLLVAYAPVPDTNWILVTHTPTETAFQVVDSIRQNVMLVIGLSLAGFLFIGMTIGRSTVSSLKTLSRKARELESGNLDAEVDSTRVDELGQLYDAFSEMRDALKQQIEEAEQAHKESEVSRAETMEMYTVLEDKAEQYSDVMRECAAGDMTQRMSVDGENESMDRIATEFNGMIEELEKTTGQLETFADEVAESGDVVLQSAESVRDASEQVAESIQKISDDAYTQQERLQTLAEDIDGLVDTLEQLEADNPDVELGETLEQFRATATTLQGAAVTSEEMMTEAESVAGAAEEQAAELNEVSSRANRLKRYAKPLGDILGRFKTDAEHEFVFSGGSSAARPEEQDD